MTGKKVIVPPHHDIMGAIGSAIIAMEERHGKSPGLKGLTCGTKRYELTSFVCKDCSDICEIRQVNIEGENPLYYGSRCGKFDDEGSEKGKHITQTLQGTKGCTL